MRVFLYSALGLTLWMLLDAFQRRAPSWQCALLLVPLAALLYLVAFRFKPADEPETKSTPPEPPETPDLDALAREVEQSPSFYNRMRMGWALLHAEQAARAAGYFEQALATHPYEKQAQYGLGISQLERGDAAEAVKTLSRLLERSFAYEDYEAALALVEAHARAGENEQAAELLASVAEDSGRLEHQLALARHHVRLAQRTEAQDILRSALRHFDSLPAFLRQRNGAAATEARRLLRMLEG